MAGFPSAALHGTRLFPALPALDCRPSTHTWTHLDLPPSTQASGTLVTQASPYLVQDPCKCVSGDLCPPLPPALSTNLVF